MKKLFLLPLVILSFLGCDAERPKSESETAYFVAAKFCQQYAPSATKVTTESGGDYLDGHAERVTNNDVATWFASGFVDAQNKDGAARHQLWGAHVVLKGGQWRLLYLDIGGEQVVNSLEK